MTGIMSVVGGIFAMFLIYSIFFKKEKLSPTDEEVIDGLENIPIVTILSIPGRQTIKIIGLVEVIGFQDIKLVEKKMRIEAHKIGANAVIGLSQAKKSNDINAFIGTAVIVAEQ